jgi:hypothetical protein
MPHLPAEIILVFTPFAPLFSARVWRHAQVLLLGAILTPGARPVTAALRAMGGGGGAPFHERSSGPEPGEVVGPPRESDSARGAAHAPSPPGRHDRPGSRRYGGTPVRATEQSHRVLSRCGALHQEACDPWLWLEVGVHDALGPSALEPAGVGPALSERVVLARREGQAATAQDQRRWGPAADEAGASLAA